MKQYKQFVIAQGGLVEHLEPHLMLSYSNYVIFSKNVVYLKEIKSLYNVHLLAEEDFNFQSKRVWLDFTMQLAKIIVTQKVTADYFWQVHGKLFPEINHPRFQKIAEGSMTQLTNASNFYYKSAELLLFW